MKRFRRYQVVQVEPLTQQHPFRVEVSIPFLWILWSPWITVGEDSSAFLGFTAPYKFERQSLASAYIEILHNKSVEKHEYDKEMQKLPKVVQTITFIHEA